jgi:hypothetical protein
MTQTAFSNTVHSDDNQPRLLTYKKGAGTNVNISSSYDLQPKKVHIEICQREALRLHPGEIEKQRLLHWHDDFLMKYDIQAPDGSMWFMLCDLAIGRIIDAF